MSYANPLDVLVCIQVLLDDGWILAKRKGRYRWTPSSHGSLYVDAFKGGKTLDEATAKAIATYNKLEGSKT